MIDGMKIEWHISETDTQQVRRFVDGLMNDPFVKRRIACNVEGNALDISRERIWETMLMCQLSTQQRSGPNSSTSRFISLSPFPLSYKACLRADNIAELVTDELTKFGGIRRTKVIGQEARANLLLLEDGFWGKLLDAASSLLQENDPLAERAVAQFIDDTFRGFGPKQSRNLLQALGLTKYEIPIDSRITKWLNAFGFPVRLSAHGLSDADYYCFVMDGIQALCRKCDILPCVLDAAIFASYDDGAWTEENAIW